MNLARPSLRVVSFAFQLWLTLRRLLPKKRCHAFGSQSSQHGPTIEKIYVINLDREPDRWTKMQHELRRILDTSGTALLALAERYVAVDANAFFEDPPKDADIDPFYTLGDQLFVEPQPLALPTKFELNNSIRMSRAEIAVARSHINVWRQIAASNHAYAIILEDDVWFHIGFEKKLDQVWGEVIGECDKRGKFDVLYLSYIEAKHGAPKTFLSNNAFSPLRGLWHLSGYVLSREGAEKLLQMLPCRGPIDLWINHLFETLDVFAAKQSIISQRRNAKSTNSYSILPALTTIGAINSEGASLFNIRPIEQPVFAFGPEDSGHSSLAMALSMLGYRCCSDLETLPTFELERLLEGSEDRIFNAYVNIGSLSFNIEKLKILYPKAKFILTINQDYAEDYSSIILGSNFKNSDVTLLHADAPNKWQIICEHLRCAPPSSSFPKLKDLGQRPIRQENMEMKQKFQKSTWDELPWVVKPHKRWHGIHFDTTKDEQSGIAPPIRVNVFLENIDSIFWTLRNDTFTDNLALFRPTNIEIKSGVGAVLSVKSESLGVRDYSAASVCSRDQYLFGKFEATFQASNVPGVVTGFFLHRNSPRQEIDIEIAGNRPDRLIVNVFYNPGGEGAKFDYGYRGSPSYIDLGFDASKAKHRFTIEWSPCEILWRVDDRLVHRRVIWDPTPIPNLPMTLHLNCWPTRSTQLAGRINKLQLPATTILESIVVIANASATRSESDIKDIHQHANTESYIVGMSAQ